MRFFASLLAFAAYVVAQADPSINTPAGAVLCQPAQITWTASHTPVFVSIIPGGQPGAAALKDFGSQTGQSLTWVVDIAAGTSVTCQIRDSQGAVAYSAPFTILAGSDSSCIGQNPSGSGSPTATSPGPSSTGQATSASPSASQSSVSSASTSLAPSTSSVVVSVSSAASSAVSPRPSSGSSTRAASATSATPSASASPNAARSNAKVGLAGLLGLAAAVVMV